MPFRYQLGNVSSSGLFPARLTTAAHPMGKVAAMVTKIHASARLHLYIDEWMTERGLNDEKLGNRIGQSRTTVWRWRTQQHRLNPEKIGMLASGLDIRPDQLWHPPPRAERPSIDEFLRDASDAEVQKAAEIVKISLRRAS